jgi:type III pantothenate kinase
MLLALDVGNSNLKIGAWDGTRLVASWRVMSRREQTADEYGLFLETVLGTRGLRTQDVTGIAIANVVPPVQQTLEWMCERHFGLSPFVVEGTTNPGIVLAVDYPGEVGADRIVNAVAAVARYGAPLICVDLGTATKFNCVNGRGEFIGGAIAPGIRSSLDALLSRAARLFHVELVRPKDVIGRNTITNIQSGFVYGYASMVDGMIERIRDEMGGAPPVVATGGLAPLVGDVARTIEHIHPDLTLEGLRLMWERAGEADRSVGGTPRA